MECWSNFYGFWFLARNVLEILLPRKGINSSKQSVKYWQINENLINCATLSDISYGAWWKHMCWPRGKLFVLHFMVCSEHTVRIAYYVTALLQYVSEAKPINTLSYLDGLNKHTIYRLIIMRSSYHISHNLTWYSAIVHKFTRIYPVCSTYELTKQFM